MDENSNRETIFKRDISGIEKEALIYLDDYLSIVVGSGDATEKRIIAISKKSQLIFAEGNDDKGV